jgi:hypothetical protein
VTDTTDAVLPEGRANFFADPFNGRPVVRQNSIPLVAVDFRRDAPVQQIRIRYRTKRRRHDLSTGGMTLRGLVLVRL